MSFYDLEFICIVLPRSYQVAVMNIFYRKSVTSIDILTLTLCLLEKFSIPQFETKILNSKDSFLRALREVVPEMELFLENHGQYIKKFVIKLLYTQSCTYISPFYKKIVS